jgi:acylphosphatase
LDKTEKMDAAAKLIVFSGQVQGVGFCFTSLDLASHYRLTGYLRNLPNGDVEMFAQGSEKMVDECIRDIQDSFVEIISHIDIEDAVPDPKCTDFKIIF